MRKREFMDELKKALDGNVSTQTYYDTMNYYEDYLRSRKKQASQRRRYVHLWDLQD